MVSNNGAEFFKSDVPRHAVKLSDQQKIDWLRLIRTRNIGAVTFRELINHFGSAGASIDALQGGQVQHRCGAICSRDAAEFEVEQALKMGARLVARGEADYPSWLHAIDDAPPLIFVKGPLELTVRPIIAIVGSRNASAAGCKLASLLANGLGSAGFIVASGLARGIDSEVHKASLETGTIAVLGGGIDHVYPAENKMLYENIAERGLLISERAMGYTARGKDFPRRNRIISGVSLGVIVVEAARRSGSLTTARFALEQGRDVFAVPGNPLDPRAFGPNKLIQDGAILITSFEDVVDYYQTSLNAIDHQMRGAGNAQSGVTSDEATPAESDSIDRIGDLTELRARIVSLLGPTPIERDELCRQIECSARQLQIVLLELDLEGRLERHGGQLVSLRAR